ncbi:28438_t:CDS:2, partial [Gigaspora margarita]
MNQNNLNFTLAAQLYNLKPHKQINNLFDPNITSTEDINDDLNKSSDDEIRFVIPSPVDINHMINYATVKNTSGNVKQLKFNHVKVSADKSLKITIPHEKNHVGGLKILAMQSLPVDHHPIQSKIFKPKPFKPYNASKPFISSVKKSKENVQENIQENIQESPLHSNSNPIESASKVIIEN